MIGDLRVGLLLGAGQTSRVSSLLPVTIHASQFPDAVRRDLTASLRTRQVASKFHYDSVRQAQKWLDLHHAYAPSNNDPDCGRAFAAGFAAVTAAIPGRRVELLGLCCGDGTKESRLLTKLAAVNKMTVYRPCDCSVPLVVVAAQAARSALDYGEIHPLVCDLQTAADLPAILRPLGPGRPRPRVITFFGALPNFHPDFIAGRLAELLRPGDCLLLSANLAPDGGGRPALERIRRQYDNALTHDWLCLFLNDLGISRKDGRPQTILESCPGGSGLQRIAIYYRFSRPCSVRVYGETFRFRAGQRLCLFFSYRYTPTRLAEIFSGQGLIVAGRWLAASEEEGVFLCRRGRAC